MFKFGEKARFFLTNFAKGLLWLAVIVAVFIIAKKNVNVNFLHWLEPFFENTFLILSIYSLSELVFGIIPPELFMLWALKFGSLADYAFYVFLFTIISYVAGFIGFLFGRFLNTTIFYRYLRRRFLGKYHSLLQEYGYFLILVAALTPLPYSAISMIVGSLHFPVSKYLLWALSRFIRFAVYAAIIWEANLV
ncbi:MAG: VTT domain-containing protein [Bacteroidales bacterium]|nr:VTT domain-containing protein [Bacteroidales bacterium]